MAREETKKPLRQSPGRQSVFGAVSNTALSELYARSRAFLFAADEDFGIVSVEAQSFGRPVIAYGYGGSQETVRVADLEGRSDTGIFFEEQTSKSLEEAILRFESREHEFIAADIREHALKFDASVFNDKIVEFVSKAMVANEIGESHGAPVEQRNHRIILGWSHRETGAATATRRRLGGLVPVLLKDAKSNGHRKARSSAHAKGDH